VDWLQQLVADIPRDGLHHARPDAKRRSFVYPLVSAYATFATVNQPAAWPTLIMAHRGALWAAIHQPGGAAVVTLVTTAAAILSADRWPIVVVILQSIELPCTIPPDPLWLALERLRVWSSQPLLALPPDDAVALHSLRDGLATLEGWPASLLDAVAEQLVYLLDLEQRRGQWLA